MRNLAVLSRLAIIGVIVFLFTNCVSTGGARGSASSYYEEFYIEGGHLQYFVSPQKYVGSQNETFGVSYVMRDSIKTNSLIDVNFVLHSKRPIQGVEKLQYVFANDTISLLELNLLYIEKEKEYVMRYVGKVSYDKWVLIQKVEHEVKLTSVDDVIAFFPSKKARKSMSAVAGKLITGMDLTIKYKNKKK